MSASCRYCGRPLEMPERKTIPLACPEHMTKWLAGRLNDIEAELLDAYYADDPRDFDNVISQILNANRKELGCD